MTTEKSLGHLSHEIWAVVPVKAFASAKQRLSGVLTGSQRAELARAMLQDVIATLRATTRISRILVVTNDIEVFECAEEAGAQAVETSNEVDLNQAVSHGCELARESRADVLIMPADVPFATSSDIDAVIDGLRDHDIVLVPALSDGGTNAVGVRHGVCFRPCFGENSLLWHQTDASLRDIRHCALRLETLGHDIDQPSDMTVPLDVSTENRTAKFLRRFSFNGRVPIRTQIRAHAL